MNNRGFTLIELIVVIAIIALLALVLTPNVINLINKNNINTYNDTIKSIESAAKMYVSDNRYNKNFLKNEDGSSILECSSTNRSSVTYIEISTLIANGNLTKAPQNTCKNNTDLDFYDSMGSELVQVKVTYNCDSKQFSYCVVNKNKTDICINQISQSDCN